MARSGGKPWWEEPIRRDDPALPNVIATRHPAVVTDSSYRPIGDAVAATIDRFRRVRNCSKRLTGSGAVPGRHESAYGLAFLWIGTVLQVLSAAWQMFSNRQSAHFGARAVHNLRPCQISWWAN